MTDFFKFETVKEDIPFYNGEPKLSKLSWAVLFLGLLLYVLIIRDIIYTDNGIYFAVITSLVLIVPFLIAFKGHYSRFIKRIHKRDIKPIILYTIAGLIFSLVASFLLDACSIKLMGEEDIFINLLPIFRLIIQLLGEELFKVILLIVAMYGLYRIRNDRKTTIIIASIITMIIFGACHEGNSGSLIRVIIVQGFGSVFDILIYLKTKNIAASYTTHLLFDIIPKLMAIM